MKSFGTYISKHLASFAAFLLILVIVNVVLYGVTFYHTVSEDYGEASPRAMLELTSTAATTEGLPDYAEQKLRQYNIWAMYLTSTGECFWRLDVPQEVPQHYSIQEVALFSKGYLEDYPVFVWSTEDGLLVLGYPKNSYMKLTSNYYSMETMESTDERLDLRHGLGFLIVQQVAIAHNGNFKLTNVFPKGCEATLIFPYIG